MNGFFKNVLANIVAIIVICAVFFIFFILMLVTGSSGDRKAYIKEGSILTLDLKTKIIDSEAEREENIFDIKNKVKSVMLYDVLQSIKKAKTDDKIKGISIEVDNIDAGITQLDDIRAAIDDFKKSGKFVCAYGNTVSQSSYYLGSVADQYYLNPAGAIELKGLSTEVTFVKDFAEKYGVEIQIIRHGKFKSAVEPFIRNDISPENKEQLSALLNDIWGNISSRIAISRKMSPEQFKTAVDSLYGIIPEQGLNNKLADKLIQKTEYDNLLKTKIGLKEGGDLNKVSFSKYVNSFKEEKSGGSQVAVLYASGQILNGDGYDEIHAVDFVKRIKDLEKDDDVKAVVLRINSPGGSANASDAILFELQQLKKKKPVVVSFGNYAASGGYYIAMAADKIYSEPNTITGSIGVFGIVPNFKGLANKNGVRSDVVTTNANSNMYSPLSGLTPYAVNTVTKSVESTYKRFVYFVTQNRKKSFEEIDAIGGGRVWSGTRGKQIGLVDELGSIQEAIGYAASRAGIKTYNVISYPEKKSKFEQLFGNMDNEEISARIIKSKLGKENYKIYESITNPKMESGLVMELPYTVSLK